MEKEARVKLDTVLAAKRRKRRELARELRRRHDLRPEGSGLALGVACGSNALLCAETAELRVEVGELLAEFCLLECHDIGRGSRPQHLCTKVGLAWHDLEGVHKDALQRSISTTNRGDAAMPCVATKHAAYDRNVCACPSAPSLGVALCTQVKDNIVRLGRRGCRFGIRVALET